MSGRSALNRKAEPARDFRLTDAHRQSRRLPFGVERRWLGMLLCLHRRLRVESTEKTDSWPSFFKIPCQDAASARAESTRQD